MWYWLDLGDPTQDWSDQWTDYLKPYNFCKKHFFQKCLVSEIFDWSEIFYSPCIHTYICIQGVPFEASDVIISQIICYFKKSSLWTCLQDFKVILFFARFYFVLEKISKKTKRSFHFCTYLLLFYSRCHLLNVNVVQNIGLLQ